MRTMLFHVRHNNFIRWWRLCVFAGFGVLLTPSGQTIHWCRKNRNGICDFISGRHAITNGGVKNHKCLHQIFPAVLTLYISDWVEDEGAMWIWLPSFNKLNNKWAAGGSKLCTTWCYSFRTASLYLPLPHVISWKVFLDFSTFMLRENELTA